MFGIYEYNLNLIISLSFKLSVLLLAIFTDFSTATASYEIDHSISGVNFDPQSTRIIIKDTSEEFVIPAKPIITDKKYDDFLNFLYRHDSLKSTKLHQNQK
jgi:hypothetical protein